MAAADKVVIVDPVTGDEARVIAGVLQVSGGGGGGAVNSVAAGDGTITIGGTAADPTVAVSAGTVASIATAQATANAAVPKALYDANTLLVANADDTPLALTVGASTFVGRKAAGNIAAMTPTEAAALLTDLVAKALFDANTILAANADDTPLALTVPASTFVGRKAAGNIAAMSVAEVKTLLGSSNTFVPESRGSNTILGLTDKGKTIFTTAAFTQTLDAAATLGAGWWCIIKNDTTDGTTVLVVDPNGGETIDSLTTITMYSGAARLIECDGANFRSVLIEGGFAKFTPGVSSFVVPSGATKFDVVCIGSGGQGGGGASAVSTAKSGGAGGGSGAVTVVSLRPADVGAAGASVTVTVGAGGSAGGQGGAAGAGADGTAGSNGASTTFGALVKAGGGGGGQGGAVAGAIAGAGGNVIVSATTITVGNPAAANSNGIGGQGCSRSSATTALASEWGGTCGGGGTTAGASSGGNSIYGGGAGGAGGAVSGTNVATAAAAGGTTQAYSTGGGGAAGTSGASPTVGAPGAYVGPYCGSGGGGGGAGTAVGGFAGGAGSIGAGGGGGGASSSASSSAVGGAGGAGGAGECRVYYS